MIEKSLNNKKKVAIFDIDGTIFRSSLLIEITKALINKGIFSKDTGKVYEKAYENWFNRQDSYEKYIMAVVKAFESNIKGVNHEDFIKIAENVVDISKNQIYKYTRELVKELKKKKYFLLAISYSPKETVETFCKHLGFDKVYGRVYEVDKNKIMTGKTLYLDLISDKSKILNHAVLKENLTLKNSIGVGDSESDIKFLQMVDNPICFNPNQKLFNKAKEAGWKIVVERKDVIYII